MKFRIFKIIIRIRIILFIVDFVFTFYEISVEINLKIVRSILQQNINVYNRLYSPSSIIVVSVLVTRA